MRVLVVGTVPPPGGTRARTLGSIVSKSSLEGNDVEVLSPDWRSAAHAHARLDGVLLGLHLARRARRFDALVLRIEADLPLASSSGRLARALALLSLGASLSFYDDVTITLDTPAPIPGGLGGRATAGLWRRANCIVVGSEEDRRELLAAPGVDSARVVLEGPIGTKRGLVEPSWTSASDTPTREHVMTLVRRRAERERAANTSRVELGAESPGPLSLQLFPSGSRESVKKQSLMRIARAVIRRGQRALSST